MNDLPTKNQPASSIELSFAEDALTISQLTTKHYRQIDKMVAEHVLNLCVHDWFALAQSKPLQSVCRKCNLTFIGIYKPRYGHTNVSLSTSPKGTHMILTSLIAQGWNVSITYSQLHKSYLVTFSKYSQPHALIAAQGSASNPSLPHATAIASLYATLSDPQTNKT